MYLPLALRSRVKSCPRALTFPLKPIRLPKASTALDPTPKVCAVYAQRQAIVANCSNRALALEALEVALAETQPAVRDAKLLGVEQCVSLSPGLVRALRAEAAPVACGEVLTAALVSTPPVGIDGAVYDSLAGIAIAARLRRTVNTPPKAMPPHDKKSLKTFYARELGPWAKVQAEVVQQLAAQGAKLRYYGPCHCGLGGRHGRSALHRRGAHPAHPDGISRRC